MLATPDLYLVASVQTGCVLHINFMKKVYDLLTDVTSGFVRIDRIMFSIKTNFTIDRESILQPQVLWYVPRYRRYRYHQLELVHIDDDNRIGH